MRCSTLLLSLAAFAASVALTAAGCGKSTSGGASCPPDVSCGDYGVCVFTTTGQMTCACLAGYHADGLSCMADGAADGAADAVGGACQGVDCGGHGACAESGGAAVCTCDAGYQASGGTCVGDGAADGCAGVDCGEHGQCFLNGGAVACNCDAGFHAEGAGCVANDASDPCLGVDCGNGTCAVAQGQPLCACDAGYHAVGLTCAVDASGACDGVTCGAHGSCVVDNAAPACACDAGYHAEGLGCYADELPAVCNGVDCGPYGHCTEVQGAAACECETGYHTAGLGCEKDDAGPCLGIGCGLHGVCVDDGGEAVCSCEAGYHAQALDCVADAPQPSAPVILSYTANNKTMDPTRTLILTAVVTDPDGIDDLIGGSVSDPVSAGSYGAFVTSAAEGSYSITISWQQIREVRELDTPMGGEDRAFRAVFYDQAGHKVEADITIHMECDSNGTWALCGGACTDLKSSLSHCGTCSKKVSYTQGQCNNGTPGCKAGLDLCGSDCVDLASDKDHCGSCTHDCDGVAGPNGWLVDYQACQDGACWVYIEFTAQQSCDSLCASKGLTCLETGNLSCKQSGVSGSKLAACAYYTDCGYEDPEWYGCSQVPPSSTTWCKNFMSVSCSCIE